MLRFLRARSERRRQVDPVGSEVKHTEFRSEAVTGCNKFVPLSTKFMRTVCKFLWGEINAEALRAPPQPLTRYSFRLDKIHATSLTTSAFP